MARKPKIEPIDSRNYSVVIAHRDSVFRMWFVRARESCASTQPSADMEAYYKLKRVWRKSKQDFDSACRFMDFSDLFSTAGVKL